MAPFRKRSKSYPFLSQEFVIQNHADIVSCLVVLVLIGLMFEVTAKTAFMFISPQYNISTTTAGIKLHRDIDRFRAWAKLWQMDLNVGTREVIHFGPKKDRTASPSSVSAGLAVIYR
uniref:translocating chain-associated membrane protein 2-like n=1 Tax=Pristiophorus japonicus TaxID=55135 RepID=UPI00398F49BC